jgi:hypothetical protein
VEVWRLVAVLTWTGIVGTAMEKYMFFIGSTHKNQYLVGIRGSTF